MRDLAELSPDQRVLLERRLLARLNRQTTIPVQARTNGPNTFPASFAQRRMWLLDQIDPGRSSYNESLIWKIEGNPNVPAIQAALQSLVSRHEILRTTLKMEAGEIYQTIAPFRELDLPRIDLAGKPESMREQEIIDVLKRECARPFDLSRDFPMRALLLHVGAKTHVLALILHHSATDGWSRSIFARELAEFYSSQCEGRSSCLSELPVQYADYSVWQRHVASDSKFDSQLNYWRNELAHAPTQLNLPVDKSLPPSPTHQSGREEFRFSKEVTASLNQLAKAGGGSLFTTLATAWAVFLGKYCTQNEVVFSTPIAGRCRPELEGLVGMFVNTLVLRVDLTGDPTFRELLSRVRETVLESFSHQDVPFEWLVEKLQPERATQSAPWAQVMFAFQNAPRSALALTDLNVERMNVHQETAKFDMTLTMSESMEGLDGRIVYRQELFEAATIRRCVGHFCALVGSLARNPDQPISTCSLLTSPERNQILGQWSGCSDRPFESRTVVELFEEQAQSSPEAVAAMSGHESLSYAELDAWASKLAHQLCSLGVTHGDRIGLCSERSFDLLAGMLGILKSGAAYVPLDPDNPHERRTTILNDCAATFIVTDSRTRELSGNDKFTALCISDAREANAHAGEARPPTTSNDLAYVMYTSGSTGVPKGVAIPHRAIVRLVRNTNYIDLTREDVVAQISSAAFDAATFEIWGALLNGGTVVLLPREIVLDPRRLAETISHQRITAMFLTTALFNEVVRQVPDAFKGVHSVLFGGETADPRSARIVLETAPPRRLIHVYGPTETTTFATWHLVESVPKEVRTIPIGRPISNTEVYVLDELHHPVPPGVVGELHLGGVGLAREYCNRPDLTEKNFIRHSFDAREPIRLYRTGDLCRWRPDGILEFVGRRDHQVKLRGFRIELGEIESAIASHPAVKQAVALLREDKTGDKRIAAFFTSDSRNSVSPPELREHLRDSLPDYMIPSTWMRLDAWPLNATGKLDRAALLAIPPGHSDTPQSFESPRSQLERDFATIWTQLLGVDRIGIHDNFFDLGGHSLLAVQMIDQINRLHLKHFTVANLFQNPTIAGLATLRSDSVPRIPHGRYLEVLSNGRSDVTVAFVGGAAKYLQKTPLPAAGVSLVWLKLDGLHVTPHHNLDVKGQAAAHAKELQESRPSGRIILCGYSYAGMLAYEIAAQLWRNSQRLSDVILIEPTSPRETRHDPQQRRLFSRAHWSYRVKTFLHRKLGRPVPENKRWAYMWPHIQLYINRYRADPAPIPAKLHLVGRPGWLERFSKGWTSRFEGDSAIHTADEADHLDIIDPSQNFEWVRVALNLIQ